VRGQDRRRNLASRLEPEPVFYALLAAIPLTAVVALASFGRVVDSATAGGATGLARAQSVAVSVLLALLVVVAAFASPLT